MDNRTNIKKKKKKTKLFIIPIIIVLIVAAGGGYYYYQTTVQTEDSEEIVLAENQELVYAKIVSISGNEMTYSLAEAQSLSMGSNRGGAPGENQSEAQSRTQNGAQSEAQNGPQGGGQKQETHQVDMSAFDSISSSDDGTMTGYIVSEETQTLLIPVGTDVVTKLGNTTTFSRLANGDIIKMILETDGETQTIMKVYMVD